MPSRRCTLQTVSRPVTGRRAVANNSACDAARQSAGSGLVTSAAAQGLALHDEPARRRCSWCLANARLTRAHLMVRSIRGRILRVHSAGGVAVVVLHACSRFGDSQRNSGHRRAAKSGVEQGRAPTSRVSQAEGRGFDPRRPLRRKAFSGDFLELAFVGRCCGSTLVL